MTTKQARFGSTRRRIDSFVLRWQARLDSNWADRVVPWAAAVGLFVLLVLLALAKARSLDGTPDLAAYTQSAWLIGEGRSPIVTVTTGTHVLAQQASFLFYPVVLVTFVVPIIPALLMVQSAALACAVVPIWRIARKVANLRTGAAATLLFVYAFYPTMHNLNLAGFHPETIGLPALLSAIYFGLRSKWRWFVVFAVVAVLSRADLGLAIAGIGALLIRNGRRREGVLTIIFGVGWTLVAMMAIQPFFGGETYAHAQAFAQFGDTPWTVAWGMITNPGEVLGKLTSEQNFQLVVTLLAPVLFLPILAPRYLVPVLPLQFLYMVATVPREAVFGQQTVAVTAFVFLAAAFALAKMGRMGIEKVNVDRRILMAIVFAGSVFFIRDAASSPYRQPWDWGGQDIVDFARKQALHELDQSTGVRASPSMLQILAERDRLYRLDIGDHPDAAAATRDVDAVVLDDRQATEWTSVEFAVFRVQMASLGFEEVENDQGIEVFVRRKP